jgi:hypothetical protein
MADTSVTVKFDGRTYTAKREGFPGMVFGDSEAEARTRAGTWPWSHAPNLEMQTPKTKRRVQ